MGTVGLHDLIGSVASSIVEAQGIVELHYRKLISGYFDDRGHPITVDITLPAASADGGPERHLGLHVTQARLSAVLGGLKAAG